MSSQDSAKDRQRGSAEVPPPAGATLASFVLFASLAALLAMLYVGAEWWELAGGFGFPSDAAWARAVLARNVAAGDGLCFNPGTPVAGVPGASWIAALSVVGFFTGKFLVSAKLLGALSVILAAFLAWHIAVSLLGDWRFALLAGLLVAASPRLAAQGLSGTEGAWAALLVAAAVHWQALGWQGTPQQRALAAGAAALAALSRPELVVIVPLLLIDRWLIAAVSGRRGERLRSALVYSLPEFGAAVLMIAPYVLYNSQAGGPLWQQPESALREQLPWDWAARTLSGLWSDNPLILCAAAVGLPVALLAAARPQCRHHSFLLVLAPAAALIAPGLLWTHAAPENADYAAAYLTPLVAILGAAGLFLVHRTAKRLLSPERGGAGRIAFGAGIAVTCVALLAFAAAGHPGTWQRHGFQVKKVSDLQGYIGRWAADHLAADASIASREVGAIGFFSRRRMVDLGGTIDQEGAQYLNRPGAPDSNLLAYLQKAQPSHLAIRPGDFPDLSKRADLLTPAVTCVVQDPATGGMTTMTLYETPWPPASVRTARGQVATR